VPQRKDQASLTRTAQRDFDADHELAHRCQVTKACERDGALWDVSATSAADTPDFDAAWFGPPGIRVATPFSVTW